MHTLPPSLWECVPVTSRQPRETLLQTQCLLYPRVIEHGCCANKEIDYVTDNKSNPGNSQLFDIIIGWLHPDFTSGFIPAIYNHYSLWPRAPEEQTPFSIHKIWWPLQGGNGKTETWGWSSGQGGQGSWVWESKKIRIRWSEKRYQFEERHCHAVGSRQLEMSPAPTFLLQLVFSVVVNIVR